MLRNGKSFWSFCLRSRTNLRFKAPALTSWQWPSGPIEASLVRRNVGFGLVSLSPFFGIYFSTPTRQSESVWRFAMAKRQDRVELKGSARAPFVGAHDVGPADPNQQIEVSLFLRRGSKPSEFPSDAEFGARPPREREYLSREEFARRHGASSADLEKIRAFATEHSLKVVSENPARRTVKLSGTVQAFNQAFGVSLRRYEHTSGTYRGRTGTLSIPAELEYIIEGVFGLDNRPQAKAHFRLRKKGPNVRAQAAAVSYSPLQVAKAYAFPSGATGSGQCIGVIELGGGYNASDLASFFGSLGISAPKVTPVSVDGATNSPTG